ncbi:hypothetical protein [Chryseobacterium sp.]|uniref:hypothetical protein n=1 Tax=Chryseobacterium sp. TaxID=1871047 RepID=UPI00388E74C3
MKQLFYFVLLAAGLSSFHSCKDMLDEEGSPLIDLNDSTGFNGKRALFREVSNSDTVAEYRYNGLLLSQVITAKKSITNIMWSGDKISQITFNGYLDYNGTGTLGPDSTSYTQLFTYGNLGNLTRITENRSTYVRTPPVPPSTTPGPAVLNSKMKTMYDLKYTSTTNKLDSILMKTGVDTPGTTFAYNAYSKSGYSYVGDNVTKVQRFYGPINGTSNGTPTMKYSYEFLNYDDQISPYTLLPFAYKVSHLISTMANDSKSMMLSPNNPKRKTITDLMPSLPVPVIFSSNFRYDAQTYMTNGYSLNYIYKPM